MGAVNSYDRYMLGTNPYCYWTVTDDPAGLRDLGLNGRHLTASGAQVQVQTPTATPHYARRWGGGAGASFSGAAMTVTDNLTMATWIWLEVVSSNTQSFMYNGNSGANGYGMVVDTTGFVRGLLGGVVVLGTTVNTLSFYRWHHVALRRRGGNWAYFVNGRWEGNPGSNTPNTPSGGSSGPLAPVSAQRGNYAMAFWDRALSDEHILEMYQRGLQSDIVMNFTSAPDAQLGPVQIPFGGRIETP